MLAEKALTKLTYFCKARIFAIETLSVVVVVAVAEKSLLVVESST